MFASDLRMPVATPQSLGFHLVLWGLASDRLLAGSNPAHRVYDAFPVLSAALNVLSSFFFSSLLDLAPTSPIR